ncbi:unnamed protein product [Anisakis simplex]|uniref:Lipase_3 domain-containing protein n=1 Tax=Anisakis simplex TaxID=6269 RepID=A0A0M3K6N9_ANISI|nr:unnamed protein product [Anisakis simplex]
MPFTTGTRALDLTIRTDAVLDHEKKFTEGERVHGLTCKMDYLLNAYVFKYIPFELSKETQMSITSKAMDVIRIADWFCKAQDPRKLIDNHPSFMIAEGIFLLLCILTFCHAYRHGGRYLYTWIGTTITAIICEHVRFVDEKADVIWHAQGLLTFCGMRTPLYAIFGLYQMLIYTAYVITKRMRLPLLAEGVLCGLLIVIIDVPLHLVGVKLLWWQWRENDPTMSERIYSVPWNMFLFDMILGNWFMMTMNFCRRLLLPQKYDWKLFVREFMCVLIAVVIALCIAFGHFMAILYVLHDFLQISVCVLTLVGMAKCAIIVYVADRHNKNADARPTRGEKRYWFDELACAIFIHYLFYMLLVIATRPENVVSEGLHQPIGQCNITETLNKPFGMVQKRQKYICRYDEHSDYFDFHCLPSGRAPKQIDDGPLEWYIICGTPFANRLEFAAIIWSWSILAMMLLYEIGVRSGTTPIDPVVSDTKRSSVPRHRPLSHKITSIEHQQSDELSELIDDAGKDSAESIKTDDEGSRSRKSSSSRNSSKPIAQRRSSSRGTKSSKRSEIPTPTHELRSRKKKGSE